MIPQPCPTGTYPISVRAIDPVTGDIGHKTACLPYQSPAVTLPLPTTAKPTPISVVSEQPEAPLSWWEEEWITGVKNKWLAVGVAAALLLLKGPK